MTSRTVTTALIATLLYTIAGWSLGDTSKAAGAKQSTALVALLPASDAVIGIDSSRFFGYSLPKLMSANQPLLDKILGHVDEIQARTGIDLRKFDSAAAGLSLIKREDNEYDLDPVVIARGAAAQNVMSAIDTVPADVEVRTEQVKGRTVYIFSHKKQITPPKAPGKLLAIGSMIGRSISGLAKEFALTGLDQNTIAFGSLPRVKAAIETGSSVSPALLSLLSGREASVMSFAASTPEGLTPYVPVENDVFGETVASIRFMAGSMDVNNAGATMSVLVRSDQADHASELRDTLVGLKKLGNAFLGNSKRADQRLYARLINSTKIDQVNVDVTVDITIPQADLDSLIAEAVK